MGMNDITKHAPAGFKAMYRRIARSPAGSVGLRGLLALVGYEVSEETIQGWPLLKRVQAQAYAANTHARASDNPVRAHHRPDWMPEPWQGKWRNNGDAFDGPTGTQL